MLVLLDLDDVAVLKGPPDNVRLVADALDVLGLLDGAPELVKLGELEKVPDVGEGGSDDGALNDLVGRGDGFLSRHGEDGWSVLLVSGVLVMLKSDGQLMNLSRTAEQCWVLGQVKLEMSDEISQTAAAELRHAEVIQRGQGVGLPHTGSHLSLHDACLLISEASLTNWLVVVAIVQLQTAMNPSSSLPKEVGVRAGSRRFHIFGYLEGTNSSERCWLFVGSAHQIKAPNVNVQPAASFSVPPTCGGWLQPLCQHAAPGRVGCRENQRDWHRLHALTCRCRSSLEVLHRLEMVGTERRGCGKH